MKTSQKLSAALIAGAALILGFWYAPASQPTETVTQAPSHPQTAGGPDTTARTSSSVTPTAVVDANLPSSAVVQKFRDKTLHIYQHRRSVDRNQQMEEQYASLAQDPESIRVASMIVGDPGMSTKIFADDQAYARVFAIGFLDYLAKNGQISTLEESVHRIGKHLTAEGSRARGVDADYVDLLSSYIRHRGALSIVEDPEGFLQKISYSQGLALDVEKAFYDSGVLRDMTPEQKQILSRYFAMKPAPASRQQETH